MKKGGRGCINALRCFCVLGVFVFGFVAIIGSGGGGGGGSDGGTPDTPTYDATGTWDFMAIIDMNSIDTNFDCFPADSPDGDTRKDTLTINQTGNSFTMVDEGGHSFNGTIKGASYTFTGSWEDTDEDGTYSINVNGSFTLSSSNSFTGSDSISGTNLSGNFCEWDETYSGTKQSTSASMTITGKSGNQVNLDGTWDSGCDYDAEDEEAERWTLTISGYNFTQVENIWFESATCSGSSDVTVTVSGAVTLGDEVTASMNGSNVSATKADIAFSSYKGTINNAAVVSDFNADKICGFDNWVVDSPKDLLGSGCGPDSNIKDILYVDDTSDPDIWYSGDGDEGPVDANGYPTNIDSDSAKERL